MAGGDKSIKTAARWKRATSGDGWQVLEKDRRHVLENRRHVLEKDRQ